MKIFAFQKKGLHQKIRVLKKKKSKLIKKKNEGHRPFFFEVQFLGALDFILPHQSPPGVFRDILILSMSFVSNHPLFVYMNIYSHIEMKLVNISNS